MAREPNDGFNEWRALSETRSSGTTESDRASDDLTANPPLRKFQKVPPHDRFDDRGICAAPQSVAPRLDIGGENGLRDRNQSY